MTQWETYDWHFPHGQHPCVLISHPDLCENPDVDVVNVVGCSTHRATRLPLKHEVLIDAADGMNWETLVRLDRIYLVKKSELKNRRGLVTPERRKEIGTKIIKLFGLWQP